MGAWLLYGLGTENQNLPGFVAMCPNGLPIKDSENWQSAFLPGAYQGAHVDTKHQELGRLIENIEHPQVASADQRRQLDLLARWNRRHLKSRIDARLEARIQSYELAFRMQTEAKDAFDLAAEPAYIREMYGAGVHARQTLIARRLLERGVRYVQMWHGGGQPWDNHTNIEAEHRKLAGHIDQPIGALLTDLKARGMLDETLVVWGGEFGRTPTVELEGQRQAEAGARSQPLRLQRLARRWGNQGRDRPRSDRRLRLCGSRGSDERARSSRDNSAPTGSRPRATHLSLRRSRLPIDRRLRARPARDHRLRHVHDR